MKKELNNNSGFTLIEAIIYIALFLVLIGGGMVGAYQVIQGTDSSSSKTILEQDASFILRKIDWALTGATNFTAPTSDHLTITRLPSTVDFTLSGTNFQKDSVTLNSSGIIISSLSFQIVTVTGKPKEVIMNFTATTLDGKLTQNFSSVRYLRQ